LITIDIASCTINLLKLFSGFQGKGHFGQSLNNSKKKLSQNMQCLCTDTALVNQRVFQERTIPKPTGLLVNVANCFLCKSGKLFLCGSPVQYFDFVSCL
jgi:hypothetical protein